MSQRPGPSRVCRQRDDTLVDPAATDIRAAALPAAQRHIIPGEGHFSLIFEYAAEYLAALAR